MIFWRAFWPYLRELAASGRDVVVCGDWNIAHQEIDLKNWKGNLENSGFAGRARLDDPAIGEEGWRDIWRQLYPEIPGYTWWSNRGQAYAKDVGWRIDYQIATPALAARAHSASVYKVRSFLTMRR